MNNNSKDTERLSYLFDRYFDKTISAKEKDELFMLIDAQTDDDLLAAMLKNAWDKLSPDQAVFENTKSDSILNRILGGDSGDDLVIPLIPANKRRWWKFPAAAAVLLLAIGGISIYKHHQHQQENRLTKQTNKPVMHDALPGGNRAVLTLANGKTIVLDSARNGVLANQGGVNINKTSNGTVVYNAQNAAEDDVMVNTISTPRGGQYQVILPDGSKVWLNSESSIKFPSKFEGKTREISITGEAYFEVAKNPEKPFIVTAGNEQVEVLGTHFNVMAYQDERETKTTLLEGKVKVKNGGNINYLNPGQQALSDASGNTRIRTDVDVDDEVAWKDGIFQFNDAGIQDIMRQAARWYDVTVTFKGQVPVKHFTGRLSRNVKASELLNMLAYIGVKYSIDGQNVVISQ